MNYPLIWDCCKVVKTHPVFFFSIKCFWVIAMLWRVILLKRKYFSKFGKISSENIYWGFFTILLLSGSSKEITTKLKPFSNRMFFISIAFRKNFVDRNESMKSIKKSLKTKSIATIHQMLCIWGLIGEVKKDWMTSSFGRTIFFFPLQAND